MVARAIPEADPVRKVTILPRGMTMGVTAMIPEEDRYNHNKDEMLANICVLMGGRAAEEIVFNQITTGASNDIERATMIARDMICRYGMSDVLGPVNFAGRQSQVFLGRDLKDGNSAFSESFSRQIDEEVRSFVQAQYERAKEILAGQRDSLDLFATELIEREVLEDDDLDIILGLSVRAQNKKDKADEVAEAARQEEEAEVVSS